MPINTFRRPKRYASSRRGLSRGQGGTALGRSANFPGIGQAVAQGQVPSGVLPGGGGAGVGAVAPGTSGGQWTAARNSAFIQWVVANPGVDQSTWPGYTADERASIGGNRPAAGPMATAPAPAPTNGGPVVGPLATPSPARNAAPSQNVPTLTAPTGPYPDARQPATATIPSPPFPGAVFAGSNSDMSIVFWQDPSTGALRSFNGTQELASGQNRAPAAPIATPAPAPAPVAAPAPAPAQVAAPAPAPAPVAAPAAPAAAPAAPTAPPVVPSLYSPADVAAGQPAAYQMPTSPFPGAIYAGGSSDGTTTFWQDPATGALRTVSSTTNMNPTPTTAAPTAPAPAPAPAPTTAAVLPGSSPVAAPAPVPTSQFAGGKAPDWLAAALRGEAVSFDSGGVIPEEVIGYGTQTGTLYRIAGSGPEVVSPLRTPGSAQQPVQ